jgi:hypothetical protein
MKEKPSVQPEKTEERNGLKRQAEVQCTDPNRWSTAVESWVTEFQQHGRGESPPAFETPV